MAESGVVTRGASCIEGITLNYQLQGTGKPLLLLHGFGANIGNWRFIAPELARSYQVWLLDLKGHGDSAKPDDGAYSLHDQARLVTGFVEQQQLDQLTLIGHSYGGGAALIAGLTLLKKANPALRRLVLIGSIAYPQRLPHFVRLLRYPWLGRLGLASLPARLASYLVLRLAYFDRHKITRESVEYYAAPLGNSDAQKALIATARQIIPRGFDDIVARYPEIPVPTLLIWGDHDRIVPLENGHRLCRDIPGARLEVVADCGHIPQEEQPDALLKILLPFLAT